MKSWQVVFLFLTFSCYHEFHMKRPCVAHEEVLPQGAEESQSQSSATKIITNNNNKATSVRGVPQVPVLVVDPKPSKAVRLLKKHFGIENGEFEATSQVAVLDHCDLNKIVSNEFYMEQFQLLRTGITEGNIYYKDETTGHKIKGVEAVAESLGVTPQDLNDEIGLQTLEFFARALPDVCDFSTYHHRNVPITPELHQRIDNIPNPPDDQVRMVYMISAFKDFPQLQSLVKAIHLPQHLIIIHLEKDTNPEFVDQVYNKLAKQYPNLVVLQFGTVIYPSDSISQVYFRVMQWVIETTNFSFDYWVSVCAASYPLYEANELARHLKTAPKRIRIGRIKSAGDDTNLCANRANSLGLFYGKTRITRMSNLPFFFQQKGIQIPPEHFAPPQLRDHCRIKTITGNTAVYDADAIRALTSSSLVKQWIARFKQAGQCCSEESYWSGVLSIIGRADEVALPGTMWQAWGCDGESGLHNNALATPKEDGTIVCARTDDLSVNKNVKFIKTAQQLEESLIHAKQNGNLFARKFSSKDTYWLNWIRKNLHNKHGCGTAPADDSGNESTARC